MEKAGSETHFTKGKRLGIGFKTKQKKCKNIAVDQKKPGKKERRKKNAWTWQESQ